MKIIRTLKGPRTVSSLQLTSYEHDGHLIPRQHGFFKGERLLLLIKEIPTGDPSKQPLEADMLDLACMKEVENQLLRAKQFQADYLQRLAHEQPALHAAALRLAGELQQACIAWPRPKEIYLDWQEDISNDVACSSVRDQLLKKFSATDAGLLYAAQAVDWFHESDPSWSRHPIWWAVLEVFSAAHPKEARAVSEKWMRHALQQAGIEQPYADDYLKTDLFDTDLHFPIQLKTSVQETASRENWTTHLLLCHHDYFREDTWGRLEFHYGEHPRELNLSRIRNSTIPPNALIRVGTPTNASTVDLLVSAFLDTDMHDNYWIIDRGLNTAPNSNLLWKTFIQLGTQADSEKFWDRMVSEYYFHPVCLDIAMDLLAGLEKKPPPEDASIALLKRFKTSIPSEFRDMHESYSRNYIEKRKYRLRYYLDAARIQRLKSGISYDHDDDWPAEEYREWFRKHPAK